MNETERPPCTICRKHDTRLFQQGAYHLNLLPTLGVERVGVWVALPLAATKQNGT